MAKQTLDFSKIPQNARTIVFECFNSEASNLCTLLNAPDIDEAIEDVTKKLCVRSFEEFKTKFRPTVYEVFQQNEEGETRIFYSLKEVKGARTVSLCEHEFYRAVHDIAAEKSASNTSNEKIDYTKLYEALNPERIYERARKQRNNVKQFLVNAIEAQENKNPDGARKWMLKAKQTYESVKEEYSSSAIRLLPLAIQDTERLLNERGVSDNQSDVQVSGASDWKTCAPGWDKEGNLIAIPLQEAEDTPKVLAIEQREQKALELTDKNWNSVADSMPEQSVNKTLFLSVFSGKENFALASLPTEELIERKKVYSDIYVSAQQSFCDVIGYLVQKVVSLEQFFLHAGDDKGFVESGVIIANCSVADVLEDENTKLVREYLKNTGNQESDKIWFAVLPAAADNDREWVETSFTPNTDDPFGFDIFDEPQQNASGETVTVADISRISSILAEYGILSFFNFNACEATSFKSFGSSQEIIQKYTRESSKIEKDNAVVLAYPNFTIIPKSKRQIEMVNQNQLYTPAVYVDAAYVAAGIVVATQSVKIQKKKMGKLLREGNPLVHFNLENEHNSHQFFAKFNPESRLNMDDEVANLLRSKEGNAFCFRSDSLEKHAFVFTARTLNAKPIYWFLTQQYLTFLLKRSYTSGLTQNNARQFELSIANLCANETDDNIVNPVLYSDEAFIFDKEKNKFSVKFKGVEEPIDLSVEINNEE